LRKRREVPKTNTDFRQAMLAVNRSGDNRTQPQLHEPDWQMLTVGKRELRKSECGTTLD
jgi:G:T-mismatch repair DNA endonuclease (very short patch repair protein)